MNKQELKEQVSSLSSELIFKKVMVNKDSVLKLIDQLDEPKKVVIPQFVAEWLEEQKKAYNLFGVLEEIDNAPQNVLKWFHRNSFALFENRIKIIARAFLDGYEIEQEKLYTVEIPNPNEDEFLTVLAKAFDGKVFIDRTANVNWRYHKQFQLTESEIRKDFEWAWQWAKPVEEER